MLYDLINKVYLFLCVPSKGYGRKDYKRKIEDIYNLHFKNRTILIQKTFRFLTFTESFSIKTGIQGFDFLVRCRNGQTEKKEEIQKANRLDFWLFIITGFWVFLSVIPKTFFYYKVIDYIIIFIGGYRLLDILSQRFKNIVIDPYFYLKNNEHKPKHLLDLIRSFLLAFLNYFEIILIFSVFYKFFPCGAFNYNIEWYDALYFSLVTITTLGGNIHPGESAYLAKFLVGFELVLGLFFILVVFAAIVPELAKLYGGQRDGKKRIRLLIRRRCRKKSSARLTQTFRKTPRKSRTWDRDL